MYLLIFIVEQNMVGTDGKFWMLYDAPKGGNLGGTAGDRPPTFRVGATYIPPPTIPEVSGDVVVTVG